MTTPRQRHYPMKVSRPGGTSPSARRRSTVRFAPYYKLQVHNPRSLTWVDVQASFDDPEECAATAPAGSTWRLMRITPEGRTPLTPMTVPA